MPQYQPQVASRPTGTDLSLRRTLYRLADHPLAGRLGYAMRAMRRGATAAGSRSATRAAGPSKFRTAVRQALTALVGVVWLLAAPALAAEPEPKCGVDMPHTTGTLSFDPSTMEETGAFLIEGGLYQEGEVGTCMAVHIECHKNLHQCEMVEVLILKLGPYPEIGPINLTGPMRIGQWTKDGLTAAGDQPTHLNVDFVHRKVQLVATDRCHPGKPAVIEEVRTFPMSAFERKSP